MREEKPSLCARFCKWFGLFLCCFPQSQTVVLLS